MPKCKNSGDEHAQLNIQYQLILIENRSIFTVVSDLLTPLYFVL